MDAIFSSLSFDWKLMTDNLSATAAANTPPPLGGGGSQLHVYNYFVPANPV
jgi:hypothetical protein